MNHSQPVSALSRISHAEEERRRRLLVIGAYMGAAVCLGFLGHRVLTGATGLAGQAIMTVALVVFLATPWVLRRTDSITVAVWVLIGTLLVLTSADTFLLGGLGAPSLSALMIIPLCTTFFVGARQGLVATALAASVLALFALLHLLGVEFPAPRPSLESALTDAVGASGILVFIYLLSRLYEQQRVAHEEELRLSETRYREAFAAGNEGMLEWDPASGDLFLSEGLVRYVGADELPETLEAFLEYVHNDERGLCEAGLRGPADGLVPLGNLEGLAVRLYHAPSQRHRWVACEVRRNVDVSRRSGPLVIVAFRDVDELRRLQELKDDFISTVSHELRTPLTSILASLRLVASSSLGPVAPKALELLQLAERNGDRLLRLVNELLDVRSIEHGVFKFQLSDLDARETVTAAVQAFKGQAETADVALEISLPEEATTVRADADRLAQVVANLVSNALKFSPGGGTVTVEVHDTADVLRFEVSDEGPGVPKEFEPRIFAKFTQADMSDDRPAGGSGLGLYISRRIVEGMGGTIGFSRREPVGTTFWFELPRVAVAETDVA